MSTSKTLIIAAIIGCGAVAWWWLSRPEPVEVQVRSVEVGSVQESVSNTRAGTVKACRRARLAPGIGGQIARLEVREGDRVHAGDILLALWNRDLAAKLVLSEREAEAGEAKARAACFNAESAERESQRQLKLEERRMASEEAVDLAMTAAKAGKADCEAARANARVNAARLGVVQAELERTRLAAPFDGVVAEVSGELNEYVTPSPPGIPTPPAVDLIDDSCFYISAPIDEVDAARVRLGMSARITLDAFSDRVLDGQVRRIAPYVLDLEKQARTVEVEVEIIDPPRDPPLLAGYSADVELITERRDQVLRVPTAAVRLGDAESVLVLDPDSGVLQARDIKTGIGNWDWTQVEDGVSAGELVVLSLDRDGVEAGASAVVEDGDDSGADGDSGAGTR